MTFKIPIVRNLREWHTSNRSQQLQLESRISETCDLDVLVPRACTSHTVSKHYSTVQAPRISLHDINQNRTRGRKLQKLRNYISSCTKGERSIGAIDVDILEKFQILRWYLPGFVEHYQDNMLSSTLIVREIGDTKRSCNQTKYCIKGERLMGVFDADILSSYISSSILFTRPSNAIKLTRGI